MSQSADIKMKLANGRAKHKICHKPKRTMTIPCYKLQLFYQEIRLIEAASLNNTEEVQRLLESGVDPNSVDFQNRSALHVAVSKGYTDIVRLLLDHNANPNVRDSIQNTPLHLAACIHNISIITMLVNAKADVSCLDVHGRNPLQLVSSKLQLLQQSLRAGSLEMTSLQKQMQDVIDLLVSLLKLGSQEKMSQLRSPLDVDDLQLMKLSISSKPAEELDEQMSKLLGDIEKFTI